MEALLRGEYSTEEPRSFYCTYEKLKPAERRVFDAFIAHGGIPNDELAVVLDISSNTLRNYMSKILEIFGVRSRTELMYRALMHIITEQQRHLGSPSS